MIFDIATFKIKIQCHRNSLFDFPESFYRKFNEYLSRNPGRGRVPIRADFTITVVPYDFFPVSSQKLFRRQGHLCYERKGDFFIKSRSATACVNPITRNMRIGFKARGSQCESKASTVKKHAVLMGFVRLAVSLCAVLKGGLPFHCSAIALGDRGIAFSGPSGAGKSTIAKLLVPPGSKAGSAQLLNDDFNIILPDGKKSYVIYSTPFTQPETLKKCVRRGVDLHTIFFIEKSPVNIIGNLSFKNKYILVLGQTIIFPLSDFVGRKVLDNAERLCGNVECRMLRFKNDTSLCLFIDHYAKGLK
jgi:hypothetical protein